jgi:hypothetical protein
MTHGRQVDPNYGDAATHDLHWTFPDLSGEARDYAHAVNHAWMTQALDGGLIDLVGCDYLRQVLSVHVRVSADDLPRAISWGSMLVFGLIERSGLELPRTATLMVAGRPVPARRRTARSRQ